MELFEQIKLARKKAGLSQADMATRVGCTQSAVSMFERGGDEALAWPKIERMAALLHVDAREFAPPENRRSMAASGNLAFCPNNGCLRSVPVVVSGRVIVRPVMMRHATGAQICCPDCGTAMISRCPNADCEAEVRKGSFCSSCGTPYVPCSVLGEDAVAVEWASLRRLEIMEVMDMEELFRSEDE